MRHLIKFNVLWIFLCVFCINHTCTTKELFILVGPRMPFRFHQCQYRLLIVNSISLLIWSLNRKNWKYHSKFWKPSCHLLVPSKLHKHFRQDSGKTTTSTLLHYKLGAATRRVEGTKPLNGLDCYVPLNRPGMVFSDTLLSLLLVVSLAPRGFFSGYSGFPLSLKTNTFKFQFDLERTDTFQRVLMNSLVIRG